MSDQVVISVENLSKTYRISHQVEHQKYVALRDVLANKLQTLFRPSRSPERPSSTEDFWALKNINFEVRQGEVVGIIGRNGAGKSTLLKILSRITEPSQGRVRIKGRIASLLEVGTGFHPELTGRENIYLNGAILGMTRAEIKKKFDEIVAFAEVEKFLDTPVKRYSSGMYVRLAFAVAAHLEPEILIVDEVLAVGDAEFQKKCLGKMQDVATREGRTVLFVSHNMTAIQVLCSSAIYLRSGGVVGRGNVAQWIGEYLRDSGGSHKHGGAESIPLGAKLLLDSMTFSPNPVQSGAPLDFSIELSSIKGERIYEMAVLIYSAAEIRTAIMDLRPWGVTNLSIGPEGLIFRGHITALPLVEGDYQVGLYVMTDAQAKDFLDLGSLHVSAMVRRDGHMPYPAAHRGVVELDFTLDSFRNLKENNDKPS
jgi:lipopolysaccharide transport system ATP-binding protein